MQIIFFLLQRIGRTGRVGNTGRATSFFDERENAGLARPLVKVTHNLFMLSASDIIPLGNGMAQLLKVLTDVKQPVPDWLAGQSRGGYY